jgi:BirA family biotin operon repressor/biotin-[acetyl-CoA-carboxylase] ligase
MEDQTPFPAIETFEVLTSTLDSIHQAAENGAPEWTTHIAREQTRGRGQQARPWWSPSGAGLWMSTLLRPSRSMESWGCIALVAGAAAKAALESLGVRSVELRWPNDLYVGHRKLGGILAESKSRSSEAWISLGIGINIDLESDQLRDKAPGGLSDTIICLREAGPPSESEPEKIALAILHELRDLYVRFQREETLAELLGKSRAVEGRKVSVERAGEPALEGTAAGLGARGQLLIEDEEGTIHEIVTAGVSWES